MTIVRAPIRYFGGKGTMINPLLKLFPETSTYDRFIDAYGGSGVVLLNKPYKEFELYNDLDKNVYSLFKVLSNRQMFQAFIRLANLAYYSEQLRQEYIQELREPNLSLVDRAYRFWYVNRTSINGVGGFSVIDNYPRRRMSRANSQK